MSVTAHEGLFRFLVDAGGSDKQMDGGKYLADLSSNEGLGQCSCKNWHYRIQKKVMEVIALGTVREQDLFSPSLSCRHIRMARYFQYKELHWHLIDENPHGDDKT